jgi:hypothetical protein
MDWDDIVNSLRKMGRGEELEDSESTSLNGMRELRVKIGTTRNKKIHRKHEWSH